MLHLVFERALPKKLLRDRVMSSLCVGLFSIVWHIQDGMVWLVQ
jgi:hypothetical protein